VVGIEILQFIFWSWCCWWWRCLCWWFRWTGCWSVPPCE